jgi:hypothetical protein
MAAEQSRAERAADAGPADDTPASEAAPPGTVDGNGGPAAATPDLSEVKRKFREALDRKRGAQAGATAEGAQDTGKVHGSHGPAASRRSFRRKSGG